MPSPPAQKCLFPKTPRPRIDFDKEKRALRSLLAVIIDQVDQNTVQYLKWIFRLQISFTLVWMVRPQYKRCKIRD